MLVVVNRGESENTLLRVCAIRLLIYVHPRNIVFDKKSLFAEHLEILSALLVDFIVVWIQVMRQVNLWLTDVIERHFVVFALFCCFLSVDDIVGVRKNLADVRFVAEEALETAKLYHLF